MKKMTDNNKYNLPDKVESERLGVINSPALNNTRGVFCARWRKQLTGNASKITLSSKDRERGRGPRAQSRHRSAQVSRVREPEAAGVAQVFRCLLVKTFLPSFTVPTVAGLRYSATRGFCLIKMTLFAVNTRLNAVFLLILLCFPFQGKFQGN